jgi:hypothetical protein
MSYETIAPLLVSIGQLRQSAGYENHATLITSPQKPMHPFKHKSINRKSSGCQL